MASPIANLPETLKIRTIDNQVIEVTGKLINESEVLKKAYEMHDNSEVGEIVVSVVSEGLQNTLKLLEFYDLEKPYVPASSWSNRKPFMEESKAALEFLKSLPDDEMFAINYVVDGLDCKRLIDCCMLFFLNKVTESNGTKELREMFNLKNDYTEAEEAELRARHNATR
uniref:Skp1 domain-containing protein n=1 Tax=Panagrellus redivivus TaxID=6233 RepID=A0A7E4VMW4_PANRE